LPGNTSIRLKSLKKQFEEYINECLLKSVTFALEEGHCISKNINKKRKIFLQKEC
jgi:hypothetical protein